MCGIAGLLRSTKAQPVCEADLHLMTDQMAARGPDGDGFWIGAEGRVGFGHRRLAIVDLSETGHQPMRTEDGRITVTFNGEIYNYPELRVSLQARGYRFRGHADTEALLYLWLEHGEKMVHHLDGDFAFAIHDSREEVVFLARDPAGLKPLYLACSPQAIGFASSIRSLVLLPHVDRSLNRAALSDYLSFLVVPAPRTLITGVEKLPAGHNATVRWQDGQLTIKRECYWEPLPGLMEPDVDLDGQLADLFDASVKKRLMSDVSVGVLFSGGVDSTLNASSFGRAIAPNKVRTFTVGPDGPASGQEELLFARDMARRLNTDHHEIQISADDFLKTANTIALLQDEPVSDPVCVPLYFVCKLARDTGTIVLHGGEGADEIFCGYSKYLKFMDYHKKMWGPLQHLPKPMLRGMASFMGGDQSGRRGKIADAFRRSANGEGFFLSSSVAFYDAEKASILSNQTRAEVSQHTAWNSVAPYYQRFYSQRPNGSFLQLMTYIELQLRLPELLLMRLDKMSMAHSVEARAPFLDRRLMEFALSVPDSFKLRDGIPKEPVKRLAAQHAPRDLIYRSKTGFGAPVVEWFNGPLAEPLRELVRHDSQRGEQLFSVANIDHRLSKGMNSVNEAFQLWLIFNLLSWHEAMTAPASPTQSRSSGGFRGAA